MALIIDESLLLSHIELQYESIVSEALELDILLPNSFTENGFASKASLCQLLNTWVQNTTDSSAILADLRNDENSLNNFMDNFGWLLSLMTIKQERKILDYSKKNDFTQRTFEKAIVKFRDSLPRITKANEKAFIGKSGPIQSFCFDHSAVNRFQYNEWFYQDGILLNETGFNKFYLAAVKHLFKSHNKDLLSKVTNENISEKITGIIKELFENTDKHATSGYGPYSNVPINPNMRGVFMEIHSGNRESLSLKTELGDPFYNYFNNPRLFNNEYEIKTFMEISILDSGPGFAQKRSGTPLEEINLFVEREFVIQCLTQYDTSASKRGLKRIATYLGEEKGFLRLRTGRLCIYWDFLLHGYREYEHNSQNNQFLTAKSKFFDWEKSDRGWTKYGHASGSLITIFFPLN